MADFSALKTAIQANIRTNANEEITGAILQEILLSMVTIMGDGAINGLVTALQEEVVARQNAVGGEATARQDADSALSGRINGEATARGEADTALSGRIDGVANSITAINTKLAEGYIYAGIATPSTNPSTPTGKVFYIALQAGTYTNFSSLAVTQGITILKYNGSAWSQEQLVGIDDEPTKGSNNLVKSGGVALVNGYYTENNDGFIDVLLDSAKRIIRAIKKTGVYVFFADVVIGSATLKRKKTEEWVELSQDKNGKILYGVNKDGDFKFGKIPSQIINYFYKNTSKAAENAINSIKASYSGQLIADSILKGYLISEPKQTLTISGGGDYNTNTGEVYVGYMANDVKVGESAGGSYACLSVFNLISPELTKNVYVASYFYDMPSTPTTHEEWLAQYAIAEERNAYFPSYGIVSYCYDTIAKKITTWGLDGQGRRTIASEYVKVITNASTISENRSIGRGVFTRNFDLATKTFGTDLELCILTTPSNQEIEMTDANCESIVTALGLEVPTSAEPTKILINTDPAYFYDANTNTGWYYVFASFGRYTHCILKSYDLTHYEFVTDIPLGFRSEEGQIVIYGNKLYVCCRSSQSGYSSVLLYYDLSNQTWSNKLSLGVNSERPAMSTKDGYFYILIFDSNNNATVDGYRPARTNKVLFKVNPSLEVVAKIEVMPQLGLCYQQLIKIGGNIYVLANCDRRGFAFSPTILSASNSNFVDCRNGLVFSRFLDKMV